MQSFGNEKTIWMGLSDLMAALMMVFLFISIAFIFELQNAKKSYQQELNVALNYEFSADLSRWRAIITDDNVVRFDAPFSVGGADLDDNFKTILNEFFPRYVGVISHDRFFEKVSEIRIEGHTSNTWGGGDTEPYTIYLNNMRLSQKRASNVLEHVYLIESPRIQGRISWLEGKLRANGMAFSKPVYINKEQGSLDSIRSRRVEFRVVTNE